MWISIGDDQREVLFGTNSKQVYKVTLPELTGRTLIQEKDFFDFSALSAKYIKKPRIEEGKTCSVYIGKKVWYSVAGDDYGFVTVWTSSKEIEDNCGTLLHGHCGRIVSVFVSKSHEDMYSIGQDDETVLQWRSKIR